MKRRMRPVTDARDQAVLDRVEMDVVDVPLEVPFIANGVFPEAALPEGVISRSLGVECGDLPVKARS